MADITRIMGTDNDDFVGMVERSVRFYTEDLVDALSIRCPRLSCRSLLDLNPDACAAITCGGCGQNFCNCCHARFASGQETHLHVPLAHSWQDVFLPRALIIEGQRRLRLTQLKEFLDATAVCPAIAEDLLSASEDMLREWDIPTDWEDLQTEAEQATAELYAQQRGNVAQAGMEAVLEDGTVEENEATARGNTLLALCWANRFDQVRLLADEYAQRNAVVEIDWAERSPEGNTAFNCAARLADSFHSRSAMQLLLELGAGETINLPDRDGLNALQRVVMLNDIASVKCLLLQPELDLEATTVEGRTALFLAAEMRYLHIARELLRRGAYVHTSCSVGTTALMAVSFRCQADAITPGELVRNLQFWLEAGVDVEAADGQSAWRALHYAAGARYDRGAVAVRTLLRGRTDVRAQTRFQQTPLMLAVCFGNLEAIPVLVEAEGENPSIAFDTPGEQLVLNAAVEGRREEIVLALRKAQGTVQWRQQWRRYLGLPPENSRMTWRWLYGTGAGLLVGVVAVACGFALLR